MTNEIVRYTAWRKFAMMLISLSLNLVWYSYKYFTKALITLRFLITKAQWNQNAIDETRRHNARQRLRAQGYINDTELNRKTMVKYP